MAERSDSFCRLHPAGISHSHTSPYVLSEPDFDARTECCHHAHFQPFEGSIDVQLKISVAYTSADLLGHPLST